jgi:hypothetical protein
VAAYSQATGESHSAEEDHPRPEESNRDSRARYPSMAVGITATASSAVSRDIWSSSHGQNTIVVSTIPTSIHHEGDYEGKRGGSPTEKASIYTSDVTESMIYAQELATSFFKNSEPPDAIYLKKICEVLPDLLRGFALRVGAESQTLEHFKIMNYIHRIRG